MVLSVNVVAALITVLVRDVFRRLTNSQAASIQAPLSGVEIYSTLAFLMSGLYFYLTRNVQENAVEAHRNTSRPRARVETNSREATSLSSDNQVDSRVKKAKFWVKKNDFQGSKPLQQQALRYVSNAPVEYTPTIKTDQNTSRFIPNRYVKTEWQHGRKAGRQISDSQLHETRQTKLRNLRPRATFEMDYSDKFCKGHKEPMEESSRVPKVAHPEAVPGSSWAKFSKGHKEPMEESSRVPKVAHPEAVPGSSWTKSSWADEDEDQEIQSVVKHKLPDKATGEPMEESSRVPKVAHPEAVAGCSWVNSSWANSSDEDEETESVVPHKLPDKATGDQLRGHRRHAKFPTDSEKKLEELDRLRHTKERREQRRLRGKHVIRKTRSGKIYGYHKDKDTQRRK